MLHHRSDEFAHVLDRLINGLKAAFLTENDPAVLTSSGTGAMEAVVVSLFSAGESVLVPTAGKFSRRWAEICRAHGIEVGIIEIEPGQAVLPEMIEAHLEKAPDTRAVLLTHCETATGSLTDLNAVCRTVRDVGRKRGKHILSCADCISSLLIDELRVDEWCLDCALAASQKGLLAPPGLAFVVLGKEARRLMQHPRSQSYYFDLRKYYDDVRRCPFTPAVSLVRAVADSLESILRHGLQNVWAANRAGADALRLIIKAAGFRSLAERQSNAVVAFMTDGLDAEQVKRILLDRHGVVIAHGQQELRGSILRVSGIGKSSREILAFAEAFADTLAEIGCGFDLEAIRPRLQNMLEDRRIWE
jgi:aspartate aminotransferase-like enzyme